MIARRGSLVVAGLAIACSAGACLLTTSFAGLSNGAVDAAPPGTADGAPADAGTDASLVPSYAGLVIADAPIAYWRFEEASGPFAIDTMGNHKASYLSVQLGAAGIAGSRAVDLRQAEGARIETNSTAFQFGDNHPFAVECWLNLRNLADFPRIASTESPTSADSTGWYFTAASPSGTPYVTFRSPSGGFIHEFDAPRAIDVGRFHHLVVSHDGLTASFWIDGTRSASAKWSESTASVGLLTLGCRLGEGRQYNCLDGILDEVAIYDHPLADDRITAHYAAGKP